MVFRRKLYDKMLDWKRERNGSSALLVKGARRVGKSTLVEEFARKEYDSYVLVDFAQSSTEVDELFENMRDLNHFFLRLQGIFHVVLHERRSCVIFDEVQLKPQARQAIKYLVKDGRYDFIETGSLLSIKKNVQNILIPSEETRLTLHPMDLDEFCWATGNDAFPELARQSFASRQPMGQAVHREWMRLLRTYMAVGGMPQAVDAYINTNNLQMVDAKKREIIMLYDDDFHKIDDSGNISSLFMSIPSQLTSNANRYKVSSASKGRIDRKEDVYISEMIDSQVVTIAYHANDPSVGFGLNRDNSRYKLFLADTGLFVTLAFWDKDYTENTIYDKLLSDKLSANLGYVYENMVGQMLTASGNSLYYYTFPDSNNHNYEVDFLLSKGDKIVPIEVKSSGYRTHKSLDEFCKKFSSRIGNRLLIYTKDYQQDGQTTCLPVYYTGLI
ncbi:MAG: ATP-binding protein [Bacteroidales bacterium]|nr:ATP-binding protein [Bacteroidales bacterium]